MIFLKTNGILSDPQAKHFTGSPLALGPSRLLTVAPRPWSPVLPNGLDSAVVLWTLPPRMPQEESCLFPVPPPSLADPHACLPPQAPALCLQPSPTQMSITVTILLLPAEPLLSSLFLLEKQQAPNHTHDRSGIQTYLLAGARLQVPVLASSSVDYGSGQAPSSPKVSPSPCRKWDEDGTHLVGGC